MRKRKGLRWEKGESRKEEKGNVGRRRLFYLVVDAAGGEALEHLESLARLEGRRVVAPVEVGLAAAACRMRLDELRGREVAEAVHQIGKRERVLLTRADVSEADADEASAQRRVEWLAAVLEDVGGNVRHIVAGVRLAENVQRIVRELRIACKEDDQRCCHVMAELRAV